ncbi:MAG: aminotransferase class III-fold pyridoxal phosphate-dependent enzyme [Nocardioidaceae bacterium]|nr:aminotransferase class III-fold pyridoxal phosphate-dependent enzyme [Nocardioidaceae bacterium]
MKSDVASAGIDRQRLSARVAVELAEHARTHPRSRAAVDASGALLTGVPMPWMAKWAGGFPLLHATAVGNLVTDIDGHAYVDFALGDTGAMAGHSPPATVAAIEQRAAVLGGLTTMLPTEDAGLVGAELSRRFAVPQWSFALSATDANRWSLRLARAVTGRAKVLAFAYCYHGSVDETFVVRGPGGETLPRAGNVGPASPVAETTRVAEFNDLTSVEQALAAGDVACVITEPALTNIGIVLPEPGFLTGLRELCDRYGTLLLIDETHTISAGPGGMTAAEGLRPDIVVVGKAIAGGVPIGAYGITAELAGRIAARAATGELDLIDVGGVGGTLAGNALSLAAAHATLTQVLTDEAFAHQDALAGRFAEGVLATVERHRLPWSVVQLGARVEYRFVAPAPRTGTESAAAEDPELEEYLHLALLNRGILMTPFHNMALMCPTTTTADVDLHSRLFAEVVDAVVG